MTAIYPMSAEQGATFKLTARYKDDGGTGIDLSAYTAAFVRLPMGEGAPLSTHPAVTDDQGNVTLSVSDEDTAEWERGNQAYRLELISPDGETDYLVKGKLRVRSHWDV